MSELSVTSVRVPGKVMLAGEYSVLDGGAALAVAVARSLTVDVAWADEGAADFIGCVVHSELWPQPGFVSVGSVAADYPTQPLLAAVAHALDLFHLPATRVSVQSELTVSYGIGSSSALRLGVLMAFSAASLRRQGRTQTAADGWFCASEALRLQRQAQTQASGYDLATQLSGGLCRFKSGPDLAHWPESIERASDSVLARLSTLVRVYVGGAGAATTPLLLSTLTWLRETAQMPRLHALSEALQSAFTDALAAPHQESLVAALAAACGQHRQLFSAAPAFPTALARDLGVLAGCDSSWSFKTTGAGGEDAVLLIGEARATEAAAGVLARRGWTLLPGGFTPSGAKLLGGMHHA